MIDVKGHTFHRKTRAGFSVKRVFDIPHINKKITSSIQFER